MEYNFLSPNCGLKVSELCLGTMTFREDSHTGTVRILGSLLSLYIKRVRGGRSGWTFREDTHLECIFVFGLYFLKRINQSS